MHADPASELPDWDDFRLLLSVAQLGSISRAAQALGVSQPTVSRRIERLEQTIGSRLFDRTMTGAALTPEGQRIVEELSVAHNAIQRAIRSASVGPAHRDDVKLIMTDGLAIYWLPRFLPYLFKSHPEIELRAFTTSDSRGDQRGQSFDLSIHYIQPTDPNLVTTRLGTLHFLPYASAQYLREHGTPNDVTELAKHRLLDHLLYIIDKGTWMTRLPAVVGESRAQLFTNSSAALCESARNHAGIALLPSYISVYEQGLVPIDVDLRFATPFWLCYTQEAIERPSVKAVVAFLKHIFDKRRMPWFAERYVPSTTFRAPPPADLMANFAAR